jgi:membrane-bound ClpP family serine protease
VRSQHSARAPFGALIRCLPWLALAVLPTSIHAAPVVVVAELDGIVSPVASEYIAEAIARAEAAGAECVVLELDTPGGLYKSTRVICKAILAARSRSTYALRPAPALPRPACSSPTLRTSRPCIPRARSAPPRRSA